MISEFCQKWAQSHNVQIQESTSATEDGERKVWQRCVTWGVNPMPHKIVVLKDENVIGCSYFDDKGFLSALAVLPEHRNQRIGKMLVAASLWHMVNGLKVDPKNVHLFVMQCDASKERDAFYKSCGFGSSYGNTATHGGTYRFVGFEGVSGGSVFGTDFNREKIDEFILNNNGKLLSTRA